jgi:hypothetical protein
LEVGANLMPVGSIAYYVRTDATTPFSPYTGFFNSPFSGTWLWPNAGIVVSNVLYIFAQIVAPSSGTGDFAFAVQGSACIVVSNTAGSPLNWAYNVYRSTSASSPVTVNSGATNYLGYVYILSPGATNTFLARISVADLAAQSWGQVTFWYEPNWSPLGASLPTPLFPSVPESTLYFHPLLSLWYTFSMPYLSPDLYIYTAKSFTGPWTGQKIYTAPTYNQPSGSLYYYAPKAHPEFAASNQIVLTYATNGALATVLADAQLYIPEPVRITISSGPPPPPGPGV